MPAATSHSPSSSEVTSKISSPRLPAGRQALFALAHLRSGDTYHQLAAGFRIGIATAYHFIREAIGVLAALGPPRPRL